MSTSTHNIPAVDNVLRSVYSKFGLTKCQKRARELLAQQNVSSMMSASRSKLIYIDDTATVAQAMNVNSSFVQACPHTHIRRWQDTVFYLALFFDQTRPF